MKSLQKTAAVTVVFVLAACGIIPIGKSTFRDPVPSGTIVAQGSFSSLNSKPVSGTASIYADSTTGIHTLRIEGISTPNESGLQLVVTAGSSVVSRQDLRGQGGQQNYTISGVALGTTFQQVDVHSIPNDLDYGRAVLTR